MAGLVEQPLALVNVSVMVEIAIGEPFRTIALGDLAGRQLAVMILVILRESFRKFRNLASLVLIAINFPPADKNAITVDNRHGLELPRHPTHPPQFLARLDGVRGHFERSRNDQLRRPILWPINRGCGVA